MHSGKKTVLAISGSTRKNSSNQNLLKAIVELFSHELDIKVYDGIANLPHFNPDDDTEEPPLLIKEFRQQLKDADGILICTPEYAHGVPGTLKNAIDWTVSSAEFSHKPTVLITASTDGQYGHKALLETLRVIEAKNIDQLQLLISFVKTKINRDSKITDEKTLREIRELMENFISTLNN
jgi:chromate reductase